jgi:hypothetical protein
MVEKLRVLHLGYKPPNYRYSNDQFMFNSLADNTDLTFVDIVALKDYKKIEEHIDKLFKNKKFDFIYKNFVSDAIDSLKMKPLCEYNVPIFVSSGDCHSRLLSNEYNEVANHHKFDVIVVNNASTIPCFKDYFDREMNYVWLPWAYNPKVHKDYGLKVKYDVCIPAGSMNIDIRKKAHDYLTKSKYKYVWIKGLPPKKYAQNINQSVIGVSTCQVEHKLFYKKLFIGMTFNKYYEIPMCNVLHIGQESADASELGFVDGNNIVMYKNFQELIDKLNFYLKNKKDRLRILGNARKHVEPMTYGNRINKFLTTVREIIG